MGLFYDGYFFYTDEGLSWNKILNFFGEGYIRMDAKKGLWLIGGDSLFYSPAFNQPWIAKKRLLSISDFEIDKYDNLYMSSEYGLYRSKNFG